jgi:hypothetical protein
MAFGWLTAGASFVVRLLNYWIRASDFEILVNIVDGRDELSREDGAESFDKLIYEAQGLFIKIRIGEHIYPLCLASAGYSQ